MCVIEFQNMHLLYFHLIDCLAAVPVILSYSYLFSVDMSNRKTKYNSSWEDSYQWIRSCPNDKFSASCIVCKKSFSVAGSGISQLKIHAGSKMHVTRSKVLEGQATLKRSGDNVVLQSSASEVKFSFEENVRKAEIIQALKLVDSNQSFALTNGDGDRFAAMFPDSKIAASYKQNETKMKYTIQYGIAPYFREQLNDDVRKKAFTFKFDETTNQQVKKQYDGCFQYWSERFGCFKVSYCGTLMVDHCPSEKLMEHFFEFINKANLDVSLMLHVGMGGPNVNLKFEDLIKSSEQFIAAGKVILSIGTCPLHIVHNSFRNGIKLLSFDVDGFAIDVNFLQALCW